MGPSGCLEGCVCSHGCWLWNTVRGLGALGCSEFLRHGILYHANYIYKKKDIDHISFVTDYVGWLIQNTEMTHSTEKSPWQVQVSSVPNRCLLAFVCLCWWVKSWWQCKGISHCHELSQMSVPRICPVLGHPHRFLSLFCAITCSLLWVEPCLVLRCASARPSCGWARN